MKSTVPFVDEEVNSFLDECLSPDHPVMEDYLWLLFRSNLLTILEHKWKSC
jgi:hypothetical protein